MNMYPDILMFAALTIGMYTASHVTDKRTRTDQYILDSGVFGLWTAEQHRSRLELQQMSPFR
jgi:hypothetical protein